MAAIDGSADKVSSDDSGLLVEAMRHLADQQLGRAERVRGSARQTFAYLTGIFTLTQAGALAAFSHKSPPEWTERALLVLAVVTVLGLGLSALIALRVERLKEAPEIAPSDLTDAADKANDQGEPVGEELTLLYAKRVGEQASVINERRSPLKCLAYASALTIGVLVAELAVALIGRFS